MSALLELAERARELAGEVRNNTGDWFRIQDADSGRAELFIFGVVGDFSNEAETFTRELRGITAPVIDLHINSPGGLVWDGIAIFTALKAHSAKVNVHIDGIAASAASFIAMAGDTISIAKAARIMVHDARGVVVGDAAAMTEMSELLNSMSDTIAEIYSDRAKGDVAGWRDKMRAETWFTAHQAVQAGLADQVGNERNETSASNRGSLIMARHRARTGGKQNVR